RNSLALPAESVERLHVDAVEALSDAEQEDADYDEGDQHRKCDADLHDQRHTLGAGGGEHEAVLQRHEADHLAHRVAPRDHHQQAEQYDRERKGEVFACQRIGLGGHAQHHHHRQRNEAHAEQHRRADADNGFDLAMDAEFDDDPVQRSRDDDGLENQSDHGG